MTAHFCPACLEPIDVQVVGTTTACVGPAEEIRTFIEHAPWKCARCGYAPTDKAA